MQWNNGQRHAIEGSVARWFTSSDSFPKNCPLCSQQKQPLAFGELVARRCNSPVDLRSAMRPRSLDPADRRRAKKPVESKNRAGRTSTAMLTGVAKRNIAAISQLEKEFVRRRSPVDRLSDCITRFAGRILFVTAHLMVYAAWILANTGMIPGVRPFDPYPFCLLSLLVALEVFFLSTILLMSQGRQDHLADQRAHLDLQISLLAEQETTKILQMLQVICDHIGLEKVARDKELREMVAKTPVEALAGELEKSRVA